MKKQDDAQIKQSILNFLEQLKENSEDQEQITEETERVEENAPEEIVEETVTRQPEPQPQPQPQPEAKSESDYVFEQYIASSKKPNVIYKPVPQAHVEPPKERKLPKKQPHERINEKKDPIQDSSMILESLKETSRKIESLSSKVDLAANCKFKFDIRRDANGFISSVIVEKMKD